MDLTDVCWFGGLVDCWFGGLVVWWFGGLVVWVVGADLFMPARNRNLRGQE